MVPEKASVPSVVGEFWTAKQRQASAIQEISYRACFKPQLPRFFIERHTQPGEWVYDPFAGRGTTGIEAALLGRRVVLNDVNPLSRVLSEGRFFPPTLEEVRERLKTVPWDVTARADRDLSMFYHPETEGEIVSLKNHLAERQRQGKEDSLDRWIRLVATNRLAGHSSGFFSVYTLPPNQATSPHRQVKINQQRNQTPPRRDVGGLILKKTKQLLGRTTDEEIQSLKEACKTVRFLTEDARRTPCLANDSIRLVVTSPPFLDVVQYAQDNWLRCWFNGFDAETIARGLSVPRKLTDWCNVMAAVFKELHRVVGPGGRVVFEVGEVSGGAVKLDEHVVPLGQAAGFFAEEVLINQQTFTKTSNIWGITNNGRGTNSNRMVVFVKIAHGLG